MPPLQPPPRKKPVADYMFSEGKGSMLRNSAGKADGKIHGAAWVRVGKRWVLEFDGKDDYVSFGTPTVLNLRERLTLEAWVWAEPIYSVWLGVPIVDNGRFGIYQQVHDAVASTTGTARGLLPFREWTHLAQAWDGRELRFYVDGVLVSRVKAEGALGRAQELLLAGPRAASDSDPPEYKRRFAGRIAGLRIYNRALTHAQILEDMRATKFAPDVKAGPPSASRFPSGPKGQRRLNNLVAELLSVPGPDSSGWTLEFTNPRTGFVHFSNRASSQVTLVDEVTSRRTDLKLSRDYGDAYETVRYLPTGHYTIATPVAKDLTVRAVAQTVYDYANTEGSDSVSYGVFAGDFEKRYVFPHFNTFLLHDFNAGKPFAQEWRDKGRRMLSPLTAHLKPKEGQSPVDAACDVLTGDIGFKSALYDGAMVDEFANSDPGLLPWSRALSELRQDPKYKDKVIHAWDYALYDLFTYKGGREGREFFDTLKANDSPVQWECYCNYQRTEAMAWQHINDKLVGEVQAAERAYPGVADNLIVVFYSYVTGGPPWITMTLPSVDSRTYLEMQVRTVALHPAFEGVRGVGVYRSCYTDEETARWAARLFRHYAIDGRKDWLGKDPYLLTHIRNPEFEQGPAGWSLKPAQRGSIWFDIYPGFGRLQGRYPSPTQGDTVIVTKRSGKSPNSFSQEIRNLEPGRLYSFRMCSADANDLTRKDAQAVTISFKNAEEVKDKCFTAVAKLTQPGKFANWHVRVFKAKAKTATLTISDWPTQTNPGGPIGQEIIYNFIKVQPYWPAD